MPQIHPTAIVEEGAKLAPDVQIGPYCIVGPEVELGPRVRLDAHVVITGITSLGADTRVYPFASLGHAPQDLKYKGERTSLVIGAGNQIREHVTMNCGTSGGGGVTRVGDRGLFMNGVHIAHDCQVGNDVVMANNATLAGHVELGDFVVLGGLCAVHQFSRIGKHVMVGGLSGVERDIIPFGSVTGNRARLMGLNLIGLKRRGFGRDEIHGLRNAFRQLFLSEEGNFSERVEAVAAAYPDNGLVGDVLAFVRTPSSRGLVMPEQGQTGDDDAD